MKIAVQRMEPEAALQRRVLVDLILSRPEPIIVLEAPAGMGKSILLRQLAARTGQQVWTSRTVPALDGDPLLWDIPLDRLPHRLPERFLNGSGRLVIAKRPEIDLPGLARAIAYGKAFVLGPTRLMFDAEELAGMMAPGRAARVHERSGGWPFLIPYAERRQPDERVLEQMLVGDLLRPMAVANFVGLGEALAGRAPTLEPPDSLVPLLQPGPDGRAIFALELVRKPLAAAYRAEFAHRVADPETVEKIARILLAHGRPTDAIMTLQKAGRYDEALEVLDRSEGLFYIYRHGIDAFDRVLAGFPQTYILSHESLIICCGLQALKRGDIARARQLVSGHFGQEANEPAAVFADPAVYSVRFRLFRNLMLIYEDIVITEDLFSQIFGLIGELPADAHIERGSFYNSMLEFYIRSRRFAEAEDVAVRARQHYLAANVPMLQFYISLHRAVMRLMHADAEEAHRFATDAAADLKACDFESPSDVRLLALLQACVDYESGRAEPLARFLSDEIDEFSHGEIWPTVIDLALHYGAQALREHFSTIAARGFLDRWRVYQAHNRQFQMMIDIREATILQNGNRWQEAAHKLASLPSHIDREWVISCGSELSRLQGRDEIALVYAWLRQLVFETPSRPFLDQSLAELLANLQTTGRQRISLEIWLAYVHKHQRNLSASRALLQKTLEQVARLGALGSLAEERYFLTELFSNQRFRDFLQTSPATRQVLRRLTDGGLSATPSGAKSGLSRRETKVLMMISAGGSNKFIANALGVSEATVKFHLGNLYRKLGCKKRREAISAARSLGIVS